MDANQLFKSLSDPTRLRCLILLIKQQELCVCELTEVLKLPQPKVSHHLATLRKSGVVADRKEGLWVYYRINPALPEWCIEVMATAARGVAADEPYVSDAELIEIMAKGAVEKCAS
ncbi:transcriptional regulator [Solemya pervernicosa gill symbiont]|uniref:Transcriptional regulator n=2 Tax=Gammaproteobacteria incertae sedis TaxID=118884 RepID=A0A1T2L065_9GAMM|nr:metalloregulator ArsR/SmtB family transcription factor [Candidatus Reidiella endopervernicosa]OOZ38346.1 transcriptional regulator [Solemya pervernicosa gill symbiont]QKQ26543.1 metalloregulator ArsR/SmtB family transcription factor [Candidatus Reidiella endopervernicosa]